MQNRFLNSSEQSAVNVLDVLAGMRFCLPGIIQKFDPATNRAEVVPAIKGKLSFGGKASYISLPPILEVPVVIPCSQSAGVCVTVPIAPKDECLLLFSDRMLDQFLANGGVQNPEAVGPHNQTTEPRQHDLTDAICVPGIITRPNVIANWNNECVEMRDKGREKYVSLGPDGIVLSDSRARVTVADGAVDIEAPNGFSVDAPNFKLDRSSGAGTVSGVLKAADMETTAGFFANTHRHDGVEPGGGHTGTFV